MSRNGSAAGAVRHYGLSKSKIAAFEQCPKRLWLQTHRPDEGEYDEDTQARFAVGHAVGAIACDTYPDGIMIEAEPDIRAAIDRTRELLALDPPRPLFEATFQREGVLVRVDLMLPAERGGWHIAEVKSSTSAKPYQLNDLATQIWVIEGAGVKIASASIRHIDRTFLYEGDGDYGGLLIDAPSDDAIAPIIVTRADVAAAAQAMLQGGEPAIEPGDHCTDPFSCPFQGYCNRGHVQPAWPISLLPNTGARLAKKWGEQGIVELTALAESDMANDLHRRIHRATLSGVTYHDAGGARVATASWRAPLSYLDFETIAFAVPRWAGTHPYEQVPFQYSLHIDRGSGEVHHRDFLDLSGSDPRRACAEALIRDLPDEGAIIAYNASFERERIKRLAGQFADLADPLQGIADRIVDLLPIAKAHWYHPEQRGSWSIKAVLPTIAPELDYAGLEIGDGSAAQLAFEEAINPETSAERRQTIDAALRIYCGRDTSAMIVVHQRLVGAA